MSHTIIRNIFKAILYLSILIMLFVGFSDPDIFHRHFYGDDPFVLGNFLTEFWPKQILIIFSILIIFIVFSSDSTEKLIGSISISGNILIPILILIYVLVVAGYIFMLDIRYPSSGADEKVISVYYLAAGFLIYIPILFNINDSLSKPCSLPVFLVICLFLFGPAYAALGTWFHYIFSGEIDVFHVFKSYFTS